MKDELLRLDLQFFAEDGGEGSEDKSQESADGGEEKKPAKVEFTPEQQEYIEKTLIAGLMAREKAKREKAEEQARQEAERKKLEEDNEYKALYEKLQAELDAEKAEKQRIQLETAKTELLVDAGYAKDQIERVKKYLTGDDVETLTQSLKDVMVDIPPKTVVDPSVSATNRQKPSQETLADKGRKRFEELKAKGLIK